MLKKQLTEAQKNQLKKAIQKFQLSDGTLVVYCIANKDTKLGLSSNQRLFLLHNGQKSIRYYSKPPPGIPFTKPEHILEGKQKVLVDHVKDFRIGPIQGKNTTVEMSWLNKNQRLGWIYSFGSSKMMYEWLAAVQQMRKNKLEPDKVPSPLMQEKNKNSPKNATQYIPPPPPPLNNSHYLLYNTSQHNQYGEVAEQIKALRNSNYPKFVLSDDLTSKNQHSQPQQSQPQHQEPKQKVHQYEQKNQESVGQNNLKRGAQNKSNNNFFDQSYSQFDFDPSKNQFPSNNSGDIQASHKDKLNRGRSYQHYNNQQLESVRAQSDNLYLQRHQSKNKIKGPVKQWNQLWCQTKNPLDLYEDFVEETQTITRQIIDELPLMKSAHQYIPVKYQPPFLTYYHNGIQYKIHYFIEGKNVIDEKFTPQNAPVLFDHESYEEAKREFYNFNLLLTLTGNKSIFKVPLCAYFQYKGILAVCKAQIPDTFQKVEPYWCQRQIEALEQTIKIRFIFESMSLFKHPDSNYMVFGALEELIPRISNHMHPPAYFRSQFLVQNSFMIDEKSSIESLNSKLFSTFIPDFVTQMQSLQNWVIESHDFISAVHQAGISLGCMTEMYEQTNFIYLKKIIISEMVNQIFEDILRSQLNDAFVNLEAQQLEDLSLEAVDQKIMDYIHILVNELFSYSSRSEAIWRAIVIHIKNKYRIVISKEDVLPGYLLGGIMNKLGIVCDYRDEQFLRDNYFFIKQNCIPRKMLLKIEPKLRRYDLTSISHKLQRISQILETPPNPENFEDLVRILDLKNSEIPSFLSEKKPEILLYLCNFIPLGDHQDYQHLGLYDSLEQEPHNYYTTKTSLLAIKWAIKKKNEDLGNRIFDLKFEQNAFWAGQFNPAITQFYDFFSLYNASIGNHDQAIKLGKSSLINVIKLCGTNGLPTADKHYQLGNIYFKIGKKEDALKEYLRTRQILESHQQINIPQYGVILLKLSILYLNFGKISDCVGSALEALKVFDSNGNRQEDEIETFQILARAYEITRKTSDIVSVGALCLQKFNNTEEFKIFKRMAKIVIFPKLASLNSQDSKKLLKIFIRLESLDAQISPTEAFTFLHHKSEKQVIMKKIMIFIDNISQLFDDVQRRDLIRYHKSLDHESEMEASEMLVYLQAISLITGYDFMIGSLKQNNQ